MIKYVILASYINFEDVYGAPYDTKEQAEQEVNQLKTNNPHPDKIFGYRVVEYPVVEKVWVLYSLNYQVEKNNEISCILSEPCSVKLFKTKEQAELYRSKKFAGLRFPLISFDNIGGYEYYHENDICWIIEQEIEQ